MCKRLFLLASIVLMLGSVGNAADIQWTDLGPDHLWSTPANWNLGTVPTSADEVRIDVPAAAAPNGPVIQDGIVAQAKGIFTEAPGEPTLTMTGGSLEVADWIWWGDGAGSFAIWTMSGGTVTVTNEFELGWGGGAGTLIMSGGTINAGEAVIPTGSGAFGHLFLNGGTCNVTKPGGLKVNDRGLIDITAGALVVEGDEMVKVNDLVAAGRITAHGGSGKLKVDYNQSNPGKTTVTAIQKVIVLSEDFEGLPLGPNVDEALAGDAVWTDTPPTGWTVDESGVPGIGDPATDGVTEWAGWAFANKDWWIQTAGDQRRSEFTLGQGTVAIADPDEWDDLPHAAKGRIQEDPYDTWLSTPAIDISGVEAGSLQLKFDSSWRPEYDDNYHQTANITVSYDGAAPVEVLRWESNEASPNFKPDTSTNETVTVDLGNPAGAKSVVVTFGLFDAGNDWWWAIDNVEVSGQPLPEPVDPGNDGLIAFYALAGDVNDSSGNGNDGIINNPNGGLGPDGSVWVDDPERGTIISFNGTAGGAYVRAGSIPQMTLTNNFTWAFWAKQDAGNTTPNDIIFGNRKDENAVDFVPRQFIKFTPTKFEWHMNGNGNDNLDYEDIPADVWLHHAVVKTADQLTYYRNGIEAGSRTITQALDFPQPLFFGGDNENAAGENWRGLMSDACIYNRALSAGEVRYLAGYRAAGDPSQVIYYSFDNVDGIVADQSGKGHDGAVVGAVTAEPAGKYNGAARFAGGGYLDLNGPGFPAQDIPTSAITLSVWVKCQNTGDHHATLNARASDTTWIIHAEVRSGGNYRWLLRPYKPGATIFDIQAGTVTWDEWTHYAGTYDKATGKAVLYINGEVVKELDVTNPVDIAADWGLGARVGYNIDNARPFTGLMDEFRMFTRALSQDEIVEVMQGN